MVWIAKNLEEPIRGLITLLAVIGAWIAIPWVTDIEGLVRDNMDMSSAGFAVMYWVVVFAVILVCGVAGYFVGLWVTKPLRTIVEQHDFKEQERLRALPR